MRWVILACVITILAECDTAGPDAAALPEPQPLEAPARCEAIFCARQTYAHHFFKSEEACLAAQPYPDFFINCFQWVDLFPDGTVHLYLTDIGNRGTYRLDGPAVVLTMVPSPEISGVLTFTLQADDRAMDDPWGNTWVLLRP